MNDETLDPNLKDALDRITPGHSAPEGLLKGARRQRQQRRLIGGGVAALLTVALMVPVGSYLLNQDGITANPAATQTPEEFVGLENPCLDAATIEEAPQFSDAAPEAGAQRAWLCGDAQVGESGWSTGGTIGPLEPLVGDADLLIEAWEGFAELPSDMACTMEYTLAYTVVFDYEDGEQRALRGELHGCRSVSSGGEVREGGEELLSLAVGMWEEQREAYPDLQNPYAPCGASRSVMGAAFENVDRGALCTLGEDGSLNGQVELSEDVVAQIRDALVQEAEPTDDYLADSPGWVLELVTQFADPIQLSTDSGEVYYWWSDDGAMRWEPSNELQEAIAVAFDNADGGTGATNDPAEPKPSMTTLSDLPEACAITGDGVVTSPVPAEGTPDEIWICPGPGVAFEGVPEVPSEPLTVRTDEAVAALRALEPFDPESVCTDDGGPSYYIVHNYPDGSQAIVEFQDAGCRNVIAGDDVLDGGRDYFATLQDLWQQQRDDLDN